MKDLTTDELKELIAINRHLNLYGQLTEIILQMCEEIESRKTRAFHPDAGFADCDPS